MPILDKMVSRLRGKTAWITGGKRIGLVVAKALAEQGVNILVSYRSSREEADRIVRDARKLGVRALAVRADVSSRPELERAVEETSKTFPKIHILINMASVFKPTEFDEITAYDWDSNINAHILGTFWPSRLVVPRMPAGSHIINITDRTAVGRIYPKYLPYVATKQAVEGLTRALAVELAPKGIFVNAIAPGPILRPEDISPGEWDALRRKSKVRFPISDAEAVEQFALLVIYLSLITMTSGNIYSLDQGHNL